MATVINFTVKDKIDRVIFNEDTGAMSLTNPNGWGGTNEDTTDAISAMLYVGVPGNTSLVELDLYPNYPKNDTTAMSISAADLGLDKLYGGVYKFIYRVVTGTTTYEKTKYYFFDAYTQCWFDNQIVGMDLSTVGTLDGAIGIAPNNAWTDSFDRLSKLWFLFEMAKRLACKNYVNDAQCIMNYVNSKIKCC